MAFKESIETNDGSGGGGGGNNNGQYYEILTSTKAAWMLFS